MKQLPHFLVSVLLGVHATAFSAPQDADRLVVTGAAQNKLIPISLGGFNGVAYDVLKFDLEVAGCKVVSSNAAAFHVFGSNDSTLKGFLTVAAGTNLTAGGGQPLLDLHYTKAPMRSLAHAFSDAIVAKFGRRGVAQTRIAFKVGYPGYGELFISDYDGANAAQVTRDRAIVASPAWGPGHQKLYYMSHVKANFAFIFSHTLAVGARRTVAEYPGSSLSPSVSRDGRLAMILSKNGNPEVYVADAEGRNAKQLTFTKEGAASPCWSPDGQWICFSSTAPAQLYKIHSTDGQPQRIATIDAPRPTEPDWSPDGKTIVFTAQVGGFKIFTVPAAGGVAEFICEGEDPSWAPNSRTVIFVKRRSRDQSYSLSLVDVPTKQVKDIPVPLGNASQPAWAR